MSRKTCTKSDEVAKMTMNKNQTKFQREMINKRAITQLGSNRIANYELNVTFHGLWLTTESGESSVFFWEV